jgi:predicted TIM-barrel fold metal-dependent hydrolase
MSNRLGYPVFDADNHLYETRDALTRYLPERYRGAIDYVEMHGRTKIVVRGQISDYIPNPTFDRVAVPGAQEEYFRSGNPEGKSAREIMGRGIDCLPAYRTAPARLELMNELDIDYAMMYPTLASLIEQRMTDDPDLAAAAIHALNQWMRDEWPFTFEGRIFSTPVIAPVLVDRAVAEVEWAIAHGAKAVLMRPAPAWGYRGPRSFALPEFDPYWEIVQDAGLLVCMHGSDSGYTRYTNEWEGDGGEMLPFAQQSPFTKALFNTYRSIQDAITSLICHGTFARFPRLKVAVIENGSGWVPQLLHLLDHTYSQMPQAFAEKPSATFKNNIWVHPFHEEDPRELIDLVGADNVVFGSDYPHPEGLADPVSWAEELHGLDQGTIRKVMGGNMIDLLGIPARVAA